MLPKKIILFDVDKTLIDTTNLFKEKIVAVILKECNLTQIEYESLQDDYQATLDKYTDFEPQGLLQFITKKNDVSHLYERAFGTKQFYLDSVFNDVLPVLNQVKSECRLGIFSEAVPSWQKFKLEMADLSRHFEPELLFISRRKTEQSFLKALPEAAYIIDDNPQVITELQAFNLVQPIWLNRVEDKTKLSVPTITNLYQLPTVLEE